MKPVVTLFGILLLSARETGTVNFYYKSAEPEDFLIGALLPVHQSPETTKIPSRACGAIWGGPGVQRVEAALQAIDDINSRSDILPNSILGVQIRDSCGYSPIGLEQASRMATLSAWQDTEYLDQPYPYTRRELDECDSEEARNNLIAVIGPSSTSGAADIQSLLVLFGIPHVGYDFTGQDIGLRERNGSYVNIVRTNQAEAQAMVSVVAYFNWTYISTAYTNGESTFFCIESQIQTRECLQNLKGYKIPKTKAIQSFLTLQPIRGCFFIVKQGLTPDYVPTLPQIANHFPQLRPSYRLIKT